MPNITALNDYPQPYGSRMTIIANYVGPANYQAGGETLNASQFGWGAFDRVEGGSSWNAANNTQLYTVRAYYPGGTTKSGNNVALTWWYSANGVQVANATNLAGETARIQMTGG